MEYHIPIRPDRSLLLGRHFSKWSLWDVVFHENNLLHIHAFPNKAILTQIIDCYSNKAWVRLPSELNPSMKEFTIL